MGGGECFGEKARIADSIGQFGGPLGQRQVALEFDSATQQSSKAPKRPRVCLSRHLPFPMDGLCFAPDLGTSWEPHDKDYAMPRPKIAFVASPAPLAQLALADFSKAHGNVPLDTADLIVSLWPA